MSIHIPKEGDVYQVVFRTPIAGEPIWQETKPGKFEWTIALGEWVSRIHVLEHVSPPPAKEPRYRYLHHGHFHSAITGLIREGNCAATFDQNAYPPGIAESKARAEVDELNKAAEPKEKLVVDGVQSVADAVTKRGLYTYDEEDRKALLRILNAGSALGGEPK